MRPDSRPLALHPQRNVPSSLLRKRCRDRFAEILNQEADEHGHPIKWAVIYESGRANKMLLISVFEGWEDFPLPVWEEESEAEDEQLKEGEEEKSKDDEGEAEEEKNGDDEREKLGQYQGKGLKKAEIKELEKADARKLKKAKSRKLRKEKKQKQKKGQGEELDDGDDQGLEQDEEFKKSEGGEIKKGAGEETKGKGKKKYEAEEVPKETKPRVLDETGELPLATCLFTATETYRLTLDGNASDTEDGTDPAEKKTTEVYEVVGTIRKGKAEWMCHDSRYLGFVDMTSYFHKDGYSMVDGVRFYCAICAKKLAEIERIEARRRAWEEKQRAESWAEQVESAERKREKAKAKRLRQKQYRAAMGGVGGMEGGAE